MKLSLTKGSLIAAGLLALAAATPASAQDGRVRVGMLNCAGRRRGCEREQTRCNQ